MYSRDTLCNNEAARCRRFCLFGSVTKLREKLGELAPSLLPAEYGGDTPLSQLTAEWAEHLERLRPTLLHLDTMRVQPRQVCKEDSPGPDGTFGRDNSASFALSLHCKKSEKIVTSNVKTNKKTEWTYQFYNPFYISQQS